MAESNTMGADGCLLFDSPKNAGLTSIWCDSCPLKQLYDSKYSDLSRADFWVASANAVIYLTSVNNALDLRNAFLWGRETTDSCFGSDDRLPTSAGCQEVEGVFLQRMGLTWKDAVALLGAHTLGRAGFSSHHGTWAANDAEAQVFDKSYFDELFGRAWTPRGLGTAQQDWTWISGNPNNSSPKLMLNTDMCLVYDIDSSKQCCLRECSSPTVKADARTIQIDNAGCIREAILALRQLQQPQLILEAHQQTRTRHRFTEPLHLLGTRPRQMGSTI